MVPRAAAFRAWARRSQKEHAYQRQQLFFSAEDDASYKSLVPETLLLVPLPILTFSERGNAFITTLDEASDRFFIPHFLTGLIR